MAVKPSRKHADRLKWLLTLLWVLLSLSLIVFVSIYQWHRYYDQKQDEIKALASQTRLKMDELISVISTTAKNHQWYGKEQWNCNNDILPLFTQLLFNNPDISGAIITDENNHIICSSYDTKLKLPAPLKENNSLIGPLTIDNQNQDVFLLQHKLGKFYLGFYFVKGVIEDHLSNPGMVDKSISLYAQNQKKLLIQINPKGAVKEGLPTTKNYISLPLQNLDHYLIIISSEPPVYSKFFLIEEIPTILLISLFSIFFYYKILNRITNRFSLRYALTNAIKHNLFEPAYQLLWDDAKAHYSGAEVLIRWRTPTDEIIMPDAFIDEAEKSGLIVPMTLQLMKKSVAEFADYLIKNPDFHLAFNLSAQHFLDKTFFDKAHHYCESFHINPKQIMFELTERELLDQTNTQFIKTMSHLRSQGYSLAIDDFGTGHASIKYLQHFPFNYLKIDKIFIQAIGTGAITETLNAAIIHMARCLNLEIIAEGVETLEQLTFLREQKIHLMQGWYFSRAAAFENIISILEPDSI